MKRGILLLVLFFALPAWAEDVKQTILLLPNVEAECRYVASLAEQADKIFDSSKNLKAEAEALEAAGDAREARTKYLAASGSAQQVVLKSALQVTAAIGQMKIKHPALPDCAQPFDAPAQKRVEEVVGFAGETVKRAQAIPLR